MAVINHNACIALVFCSDRCLKRNSLFFKRARAEEEDRKAVEAKQAVVGDWRGPSEDTRMKTKTFANQLAIDFIKSRVAFLCIYRVTDIDTEDALRKKILLLA